MSASKRRSEQRSLLPAIFASGFEMRWGVRIQYFFLMLLCLFLLAACTPQDEAQLKAVAEQARQTVRWSVTDQWRT